MQENLMKEVRHQLLLLPTIRFRLLLFNEGDKVTLLGRFPANAEIGRGICGQRIEG